ncbi:hypothetical protein D3C75_1076870 [compost metagenome]|uniref:Uncharacterized protein n=1 Tax=Paenibacillus jilunlii TaxID=682956 RepID=A0A1G9PLW3_9BACL|nr:hypothetical protein [Paenibacillus jilunlii]KWX70627.1 hypothetical protein AML91_26600 [Paenibacillus jilunlii]SDL99207.1 hypothetical protein SAMN05216191_107236 [Paenibacillus jilunlii]
MSSYLKNPQKMINEIINGLLVPCVQGIPEMFVDVKIPLRLHSGGFIEKLDHTARRIFMDSCYAYIWE